MNAICTTDWRNTQNFCQETQKDEQLQRHRHRWHGIETKLREINRHEQYIRSRMILNSKTAEQEQSLKYLGYDTA
jgi:hypothetical protein